MTDTEALATTAFGVTVSRAAEHGRPDRLFADPYADRLLDAADPAARAFWTDGPGTRLAAAMGDHVALRTRLFDDFLTGAAGPQVVLVAAGLDTRAYRLDWPAGTRLYELDQPTVLDFKASAAGGWPEPPRCDRVPLPVDLRDDWPARLIAAGFDPDRPATWLLEGLLVYLTAGESDTLLGRIGALSAPGSRLAVEYATRAGLGQAHAAAGGRTDGAVGLLARLWRNDRAQDPIDWLDRHGWRARRHDLAVLSAALRRPVPPVFDPARPDTARIDLLTAVRTMGRDDRE
jgi:methyltransferase (TIGR00027 family)